MSGYKHAAQTQCSERKIAIIEQQLKFLRKLTALNYQNVKLCELVENVTQLKVIGLGHYNNYLDKILADTLML